LVRRRALCDRTRQGESMSDLIKSARRAADTLRTNGGWEIMSSLLDNLASELEETEKRLAALDHAVFWLTRHRASSARSSEIIHEACERYLDRNPAERDPGR